MKNPMQATISKKSLPVTIRCRGAHQIKMNGGAQALLFWCWVIGLFLTPMIEWMISLSSERIIPIGDLWMLGVLMLWMLTGTGLRTLRFPPKWIMWSLIGFLTIATLSVGNASNPLESFFYLLRFVVLNVLLYVVLPLQFVTTRQRGKIVLWIFLLLGIAGSAMGVVSVLFRPDYLEVVRAAPLQIGGIFPYGQTPNLLAELLLPVIPIAWAMMTTSRLRWQQSSFAILFVILVVVSLLTFSRAAWLSTVLVLGLLFVLFYRKHPKALLRKIARTLMIFFPLMILMIFFLQSSIVESSNQNRLYLQEISMRMFHRHPWVGSGIGTFMDNVDAEKYYQLQFGGSLDAHGIPQKLLAETGVLGLVTFLGFMGSLIAIAFRMGQRMTGPDRVWAMALVVSMVGIVFSQMFNTTYFTPKLWVPMGVGFAFVSALYGQQKTTH